MDIQNLKTSALTVHSKWIWPATQHVQFCSTTTSSVLGTKIPNMSIKLRKLSKIYGSDSSKAADSSSPAPPQSPNDPYLKHACKSCSFVYDEEKGFKKRYPPGLI